MIHRLQRGLVPPKPHTVFQPEGKLAFEHCFTRQGFEGSYAIFYHREAPHWIKAQEELGLHPGYGEPESHPRPLRRHFMTNGLVNGGSAFLGRERLLGNADVSVWFAVADQPDPALACNADGDELVFVFSGSGVVRTPFGVLKYCPEDYVYLPRGVFYRWEPAEATRLFILEGHSWIDLPAQYRHASGQLKMDAPYSHRDFREPEWQTDNLQGQPFEVVVKRQHYLTRQTYVHHPFDVLGWDGQVWPFVFPMRAFQPKAGLVHLPPTVHTTFVGGGFVICSFVPRMTDFHPQAIPCPYPHSSVDCDELLFYVAGNFTSRKGVGPGSMSLHPVGMPHGPHPGTYEASIGTHEASELAVMLDTYKPLLPTRRAHPLEDTDYQMSWIRP
ncbi:MAG: homogentisate 1,2-dioxygenase [Candidatus Sericytochromatia bacterium]